MTVIPFYSVVKVVFPCNCEMQNRRENYMDDDQLVSQPHFGRLAGFFSGIHFTLFMSG